MPKPSKKTYSNLGKNGDIDLNKPARAYNNRLPTAFIRKHHLHATRISRNLPCYMNLAQVILKSIVYDHRLVQCGPLCRLLASTRSGADRVYVVLHNKKPVRVSKSAKKTWTLRQTLRGYRGFAKFCMVCLFIYYSIAHIVQTQ